KTKYLPLITGIAAVINVGLNIVLIPPFGLMGAAVVTLISYFAMLAGIFIVTNKYYPVKYEYKKISMIFISLFVSYAVFLIIQNLQVLNHWYIKLIIIILFVVSIFAMKIINFQSLKNLRSA
ncbi:MAG TPA: polysaccharide biosynthesis C-terminal domain-containing protein, partial [Ignavibacteria bacterium]|nr:polysaccharide biosynthesis C-terminal domain-containing protein [Ignavibacteria bacterium]